MKDIKVEPLGHLLNPLGDLLILDPCVIVDGWPLPGARLSFTFDNSSGKILCACLADGLAFGGLGLAGGFGFGLVTGVGCSGLGVWAAAVGC